MHVLNTESGKGAADVSAGSTGLRIGSDTRDHHVKGGVGGLVDLTRSTAGHHGCSLKKKWVYLVGDSSFRMLTAAFVERLNGTLEDPQFGSYMVHDKGGCTAEEDGAKGFGCLREYISWEHGVRLTFTFKTIAAQPTAVLDHLVTVSAQPDVFVLTTGAWDKSYGHQITETVRETIKWVDGMLLHYPTSKFIFFTLVACHKEFKKWALAFNAAMRNNFAAHARVHLFDREPSTVLIENNKTLCEGWHAYGPIVKGHLAGLLDILRTK